MLEEVMLDEDEMGNFPLANAHSITVVMSIVLFQVQRCQERRVFSSSEITTGHLPLVGRTQTHGH